MGYDSKGILVFNLKYEHAISFINLVKFINYYQMPRSISSKLFVIVSGGGEANVYGSSYYWNFRTSSFKQVACLILSYYLIRYICWYITVAFMLFPHKLNKSYLRFHNPTHFAVIQCRTPLLSYLDAMHHGKSLQMFERKWRHECLNVTYQYIDTQY